MSAAKPFLGVTHDRDKALDGIASFKLTVAQDRFGRYTHSAWQREAHYSKSNLPRYCVCANPRCQQGGLDLQQIVTYWPPGERTFPCNGHEGTPKGRRVGDPCDNSFVVTLVRSEDT